MMPRLEAERDLRMLSLMFAAEGRMLKDGDQARLLEQLERRAAGIAEQKPKATPAQMEAFGMRVKMHRTEKGGARPPARLREGEHEPSG